MKATMRKSHKRMLIIIFSIIALILILALLANEYWSPILAREVKKTVLKSSDSLYTVTFSDANLHILKGEIDIYNLTLKPDTAVYNRRKKNHLEPNNLVELHVKRLSLFHIHPFNLYFNHILDIDELILKQPEIKVSYQLNHTKDTVLNDRRTTWQKISKTLKSIHIGKIVLGDVKFKYEDYSGVKLAISELKEMNLGATDLLIDSATQTDRLRLLYCRNIEAELNNYSGRSKNGLYNYKIDLLRLSTQTSTLTIQGLDLQPVKPDVFFNKSFHDRFRIHLDTLQLNHFDFVSYHKYRILNGTSLILNSGRVEIISNPRQSPAKTNRIKSFPHLALQQLSTSITLDSIIARHIDISYTEFNKKSNKTGTVTFNNSEGHISNVTTNKDSLQKNNTSVARITSNFMNSARLEALFTFNLADQNAAFSYKGSLGPMNLQVVNQAIMPLALVKINSGKLKRMNFDIKANGSASHGKMLLLYNDLKITVLNADTLNDRLKHMTIASLYANIMVIKHDNPDNEGGQPRTVYISYHRPDTVAFFGSIWKTLLAGIKPSAGYDEKTQQTVKERIADLTQKKQARIIKKAIRKQRRAERRLKREQKDQLKDQKKTETQ